ncbi:MAG: adenylyltransferase/cytidyltransferase family protein [Thermoprotei archaeon]
MKRKKVLVAGTFDIIHPGHLYLFKKANELGDVIVIVARDNSVKRFKGRPPVIPEQQRLEVVSSIKYVKKAILGHDDPDILKIVEEIKPDIILLGPDQNFKEEDITKELERRGLRVEVRRAEQYIGCSFCSTSKIIRRVIELYKDNQIKIHYV